MSVLLRSLCNGRSLRADGPLSMTLVKDVLMRLQHWMTSVTALLLIGVSAPEASAQQYDPTRVIPAKGSHLAGPTGLPPSSVFSGAIPDGNYPLMPGAGMGNGPMPPGSYVNPGAIPNYHAVSAGQQGGPPVPNQFNPWPQMSPYDHSFSEHYNDDGLWFHDHNNDARRYFFSADYIRTKFRLPREGLVGSENTDPNQFSGILTGSGGQGTGTDADTGDTVDSNNEPVTTEGRGQEVTGGDTSGGTGGDTDQTDAFGLDIETVPFAPTTTREAFENWEHARGVRLKFGFWEPDASGFELDGFWTGRWDDTQDYGIPGANNAQPETLMVNNPGLPLDDIGVALGPNRNTAYDTNVFMNYKVEAWGANFAFMTTPWVRYDHLKVRTTWGGRYLGVEESFTYAGRDSGLNYSVPNPPGVHPDADSVQPGVLPYSGILQSETESHLAGPEIGLRYDMGGDNFKLVGETKVGLMGNSERIAVSGAGLGNGFDINYDPSTVFATHRRTSHLSPLLQQSIVADMNIVHIMPLLKKFKFLETAKVRFGYTFLVAWEVARPTDVIDYIAPPTNPQISVDRTDWYMQSWNVGFVWTH